MKVIDLLNKIANGEEIPARIKYNNEIYIAKYNSLYDKNYYNSEDTHKNILLLKRILSVSQLTEEVEIIEDKKIEHLKLNNSDVWTGKTDTNLIVDKINEVIDYINKENK